MVFSCPHTLSASSIFYCPLHAFSVALVRFVPVSLPFVPLSCRLFLFPSFWPVFLVFCSFFLRSVARFLVRPFFVPFSLVLFPFHSFYSFSFVLLFFPPLSVFTFLFPSVCCFSVLLFLFLRCPSFFPVSLALLLPPLLFGPFPPEPVSVVLLAPGLAFYLPCTTRNAKSWPKASPDPCPETLSSQARSRLCAALGLWRSCSALLKTALKMAQVSTKTAARGLARPDSVHA